MYNLCRVSKNCYNSSAHGHERLRKLTELWVLILLWYWCWCLIIIVRLALFMIMWELELKHNLATQVLMIKLDLLKLFTTVQPCLAFWAFNRPCYICWVRHVLTLAIFPTPQPLAKVAQKIDEDIEVPRRLTGVLGICYPQSAIPVKTRAWRLVTVPRYSDVSVNIAIYMLFNNIVSNTIHYVVVCVDFLGTHMTSLVLFLKLGVTGMQCCCIAIGS
jgi:hypothetical protein